MKKLILLILLFLCIDLSAQTLQQQKTYVKSNIFDVKTSKAITDLIYYLQTHPAIIDSSVYATKNFFKTIRVNSGYGLSGGNTIFSTFTMTTDTTRILSKVGAATLFPYKSAVWGLLGNANTDTTINFIGTTDAKGLFFKTNNTERFAIHSNGLIGMGIAPTSGYILNVGGGSAGSINVSSNITTLTQFTSNRASLTTTPTNGLFLNESTASSSGVPVRISPRIQWLARAWNTTPTATSQIESMSIDLVAVTGTTTSGYLRTANITVDGTANATNIMNVFTSGKFSYANGTGAASIAPSYTMSFNGDNDFTFGVENNTNAATSGVNGTWTMSGGAIAGTKRLNGGIARLMTGASNGAGSSSIRLTGYTRSATLSTTTTNTTEDRLVVPSVKNLVDNANDTLFSLTLTSDSTFAGVIHYSVIIQTDSATTWRNQQAESGEISFTGFKHKGIIYYNVDIDHEREKFTSGTLTTTLTPVLTSGVVYFIIKYDSSLNPTAGQMKARYIVQNNSSATLTQY